jgi:hypothetical protein
MCGRPWERHSFILIVLCFEKFKTIQLSKLKTKSKQNRAFPCAKFCKNVIKIISKQKYGNNV